MMSVKNIVKLITKFGTPVKVWFQTQGVEVSISNLEALGLLQTFEDDFVMTADLSEDGEYIRIPSNL